jgi:hypothetical protein
MLKGLFAVLCALTIDTPFLDFTVTEEQGIARAGEPVRVACNGSGVARLWNLTAQREEPVQREDRRILFLATAGAKSRTRYRLHYGKPGPTLESAVRVSGEDLAWKIDTSHFTVDLNKNPGTGRSGQINTIYVKDPGVLLTRNRPTSTLHLSPNAAVGGQWNGINRWDPPERHAVSHGPLSFRVEREGPMPYVPNLRVRTAYEFFAGWPAIAVEESIEATADARVSLLRLCEWSLATGAENPFSQLGWEDAAGSVSVRKKEKEETLPLDTRWMAFIGEARRFGFAAVTESLETEGGPLAGPAARFAGDPHYFYRTLINAEKGPLVMVPRGARYRTRYWIYAFRMEGAGLSLEGVSRFYRAVQQPLRVRIDR